MAPDPKKAANSPPNKQQKDDENSKDPQKQAADPDGTGVPVGEDEPANEPPD